MLSHNQGKYGDDYHCEKVLGHTELGGGGYTDRQTDRQKRKGKGLAAGATGTRHGVPKFSAQGPSSRQAGLQAWAGSPGCSGRKEPGGLVTPHIRPGARNTAAWPASGGPEGMGTVCVAGGKWTWK